MSVTSTKTFYSVGINSKSNRWEVVLVDFWSDGYASMMQINEFDSQEEAQELGNKLQTDLVNKGRDK